MTDKPLDIHGPVGWQVIIDDRFVTKDGRYEHLYIVRGPTWPCEYYVGPVLSGPQVVPRFNWTSFYYRTEDEALSALIEMKSDLQNQ